MWLTRRPGKLVGSIANLHGTHGIALDTAGKFGYISDGGGNAVVVFDRATLATVATIPAGTNPDAIVFEPATQTVWTFNGRSHDATVIDAATRKVVATIPLPGKPEFAVADGKGTIFDNIEDKGEIVRLDAHTNKLTAEWPLTGCDGPSGLAFDIDRRKALQCLRRQEDGRDRREDRQVACHARHRRWPRRRGLGRCAQAGLFVQWSEARSRVIDAGAPGYPAVEELATQRGARTMAYDSAADRIYLVTAEFGPRPEPTPENPRPRPAIIPGSFVVLVVGR